MMKNLVAISQQNLIVYSICFTRFVFILSSHRNFTDQRDTCTMKDIEWHASSPYAVHSHLPTTVSQTFIICPQSLHYIGMSSHILYSLGKFAPCGFWIIVKPKVYDFNFASLRVPVPGIIPFNVLQIISFNTKLHT